jgi:hypothetical protein
LQNPLLAASCVHNQRVGRLSATLGLLILVGDFSVHHQHRPHPILLKMLFRFSPKMLPEIAARCDAILFCLNDSFFSSVVN